MSHGVATSLALLGLAVTVSAVAYAVLAWAFRLFPFSEDEEEEDGSACLGCGSETDPQSRKGTCGALECDSWARDPWSGVDARHGDDGNSGHG